MYPIFWEERRLMDRRPHPFSGHENENEKNMKKVRSARSREKSLKGDYISALKKEEKEEGESNQK